MPRVKFDYIVSFSSEDPEHPASNLLSLEVSKKKWLCAAGETSASVVLQLDKAVQIGTVAVGAHHAALVEVLVGRSETPADPYQVLVASCVFLSPVESRKAEGAGVERVRTFSGSDGIWAQRWDRLRVLVSQPYNKHCKFGVSFVHVFTPDAAPTPSRPSTPPDVQAVRARSSLVSALDNLSSDEDEFKPGELFAQHKTQTNATTDTGSQIRRASSQLLRTSTDSPQLVKTPRNKHTHTSTKDNDRNEANVSTGNDRTTSDDRSSTKRKRETSTERDAEHKKRKDLSNDRDKASDESGTSRDTGAMRERRDTHQRDTSDYKRDRNRGRTTEDMSTSRDTDRVRGKRDTWRDKTKRNTDRMIKLKSDGGGGAVSAHGVQVLAGVVCVLSGYENPRRAAVRSAALALGATVQRDWGPTCTHLICAFPKTPKLAAVRRDPNGARVPAVVADWVESCARLRRRLPEEWFSTEPARRVSPPPGALDVSSGEGEGAGSDSDDTDDEIRRALRSRPSPHASASAPPGVSGSTGQSTSVSDDEEGEGDTTDVEPDNDVSTATIDSARALPPLLRDLAFVSSGPVVDRYVRAYAGTVVPVEAVEDADVVYALREDGAGAGAGAGTGAGAGAGRGLRLRWLWRVHEERKLPPIDRYLID